MLADEVTGFGEKLKAELGLPVEFYDERMTTMQIDRMLTDEADISREKRKLVRDKLAASLILQSYLDSKV
jgi:putative Holliday junction resolvase